MSKEHLATYLNDHLAGATFALELLDHLIEGSEEPVLRSIRNEIEEDRQLLRRLMAACGISESRIRKAGSWIAEQLSEVKFNADDDVKGPLQRLERLEALSIGIEGKVGLWKALRQVSQIETLLPGLDFENLGQRASHQRASIEALRLDAARLALANP
jgi:hypothetical protein